MKIEIEKIYSRELVQNNPNKLYIFGENVNQQYTHAVGGGQAVIRGLKNTFGFCTLDDIGVYWKDEEYVMNAEKIMTDILSLLIRSKGYDCIVFPYYGLGTGRANLQKAPKTFLFLCNQLFDIFGYNNLENLKPSNF